jgi:tRNA nucleotidyltransferase (CCA-adding enzyme)
MLRAEHFAHGADIGIRGIGPTREAAFEQAAIALTAIVTDLADVAVPEPVAIDCDAARDDLLLVDWLNRLIYEMAARHMVFGRFAVTIAGRRLHATAWGEHVDAWTERAAAERAAWSMPGVTQVEDRIELGRP